MSSDVVSELEGLLLNNYASAVMVTVVTYDYILTLPSEIKYIWSKPWTLVSTLFVVVRYIGLYCAFVISLVGSTFFPGPQIACTVIVLAFYWGYTLFIAAADLVMVLRVYAMWNRSKIILGILLLCYIVEVIFQVVTTGIFDNPDSYLIVSTVQFYGYSFCYTTYDPLPPFLKYSNIAPPVFDFLLLVLAVTSTLRQSIEMYKATKRWQPNRYMMLLAKEGVLYLVMNLLNNITNMMGKVVSNPLNAEWLLVLSMLGVISLFPIMPRFIMSIRQLYESDIRGRWEGADTGFGVVMTI